jgi:hypothetical protein
MAAPWLEWHLKGYIVSREHFMKFLKCGYNTLHTSGVFMNTNPEKQICNLPVLLNFPPNPLPVPASVLAVLQM